MKYRQIIAILSALFIVLTVFCSCKKEEEEFIPNTPEITFDTKDKGSAEIYMESKTEIESTDDILAQGTTAATTTTATTATTEPEDTETSSSTTKKVYEITSFSTTSAQSTTKKPDNAVETQTKTTTQKDTSITKKPTNAEITSPVATTAIPTTSPVISTSVVVPLTAKLKYLKEPTNSFISKITAKDLSSYNMSEADKASFLSDRSGWAEYTVRIYFKNNDTVKRATVYMLQIKDNGKNGVYIDCDPKGDLSIAPGTESSIPFNVLVKDGSMLDTLVLKTASEMQIKVKYAATPENDSDIPNYKYANVE